MALNDIIGNFRTGVLGLGLILAAGCEGGGDGATSAGCKNDSECKGNRICDYATGMCVEDNENSGKDTHTSISDTLILQKDTYSGNDTNSPKDVFTYQDSISCQDECSLGEKKCLDSQVMECLNSGEGCTSWNLAEDCGEAHCNTDFECECDPYAYQNQCQNGVLTYCEVISRKPTQFDCYAEGFPHCGYVDVIGNSICFGNGGQGSSCQEGVIVSGEGTPQNGFGVIKSECDYEIVDICIMWSGSGSSGVCRSACQTSDDCSKYFNGYCNSFSEGKYCIEI